MELIKTNPGIVVACDAQYLVSTFLPVPGSSEVQRFGNCLSHFAAIEVERVSVSMWRQLPTAAAHFSTLDELPALLRHATGLKVVLDGAGQVGAR